MEPAKVDWKNVQWRFVEDELYEHINAPKWVDFTAIHDPVDDEAWFCRPGEFLFRSIMFLDSELFSVSSFAFLGNDGFCFLLVLCRL